MFKKKIKCPRCGKKVSSNFSYCPFCGEPLPKLTEREKKEGQRERQRENKIMQSEGNESLLDSINSEMPFFIRFPFKKIIREIEKQFKDMDKMLGKEIEKPKAKSQNKFPEFPFPVHSSGISISISSSNGKSPVINVKQFGKPTQKIQIKEGQIQREGKNDKSDKELSTKLAMQQKKFTKKMANLPREEPKTSVRRLTNKIVYEILLPGVKDEKNIIINKLQNSIEIKAFAKDKAYFKLIPLALPIKDYYLEKGKLILELKPD